MKNSRRFEDDPVVAEVRAIRARLWKEAGGTIDGFLKLLAKEKRAAIPADRSKVRRLIQRSNPR